MKLKCQNPKCLREWEYTGSQQFYASCPRCLYKVKIDELRSLLRMQEGKSVKITAYNFETVVNPTKKKEVIVLRVTTLPLFIYDGEDYVASKLFNVYSKTRWSKKGNLAKVLEYYNIKTPKELIGKMVSVYQNKNGFLDWSIPGVEKNVRR